MTIIRTTWVALDDTELCSFEELQDRSGLSEQELSELVDIGTIVGQVQVQSSDARPVYSLRYVGIAQTARNLRDDFELDHHGIALAMTLLARIEALQRDLATARATR